MFDQNNPVGVPERDGRRAVGNGAVRVYQSTGPLAESWGQFSALEITKAGGVDGSRVIPVE